MAREKGIYVFLEGQGADETLGGYEYYYTYYLADLALRDESKARKLHRDYALKRGVEPSALDTSFQEIVARGMHADSRMGQDGTTTTQEAVLSPELLGCKGTGFEEANLFALRFENVLYRDLFYTKVPRVLRFKDKASMMHGVELRVPFLDHRLVELSFSISPEKKLVGGFTKFYLRQRMAGRLPDEIGFHVKRQVQTPQREWLRGTLRPFVEEVINSGSFKQRGLFIPNKVHKIYSEYIDFPEAYPNSFFIWQWLLIEWWFRIFIDNTYAPSTYDWPNSSNVRRYPPINSN
jgi:asparagine synthetase B (glutamine-hydrolysing)